MIDKQELHNTVEAIYTYKDEVKKPSFFSKVRKSFYNLHHPGPKFEGTFVHYFTMIFFYWISFCWVMFFIYFTLTAITGDDKYLDYFPFIQP